MGMRCPQCRGKADNGNDRCVPPNAYNCTRCVQQEEALAMANAVLDYGIKRLNQTPPHTQYDLEALVGQCQAYAEKYTPTED